LSGRRERRAGEQLGWGGVVVSIVLGTEERRAAASIRFCGPLNAINIELWVFFFFCAKKFLPIHTTISKLAQDTRVCINSSLGETLTCADHALEHK
jgi:hypothetical protein